MFGPKSGPAKASALRKPGAARRTSSSLSSTSSSAAAQRQASQSSLLAAGKSTSRSSILSDTTASVCSSTSRAGAAQASTRSKLSNLPLSSARPSASATLVRKSGAPPASPSPLCSLSGSSAANRRVPTLAMSLRDKDQQIKLLIKERDEQKFQAELMARRADEWQEKFEQSELERSHMTSEADDEVVELRRLAQEFEDENRRLAQQLADKEQAAGDTQFKLDELEIERAELRRQLEDKEDQLSAMEQEQRELANGRPLVQLSSERAVSKAKYEREIEELREQITSRDEQMIQLRTSLEMRKNEVANLQSHAGDLERKLKIESERSERHLKRIDEINLELKAAEAKLSTKAEENDMYEKQVRQLRQELRAAEEKLEQMSLARKKDVDILHNKLSAARRGSTTPTSPQPYKTPTPLDEIVRLQMEIRDLKEQLIDREAELDCNRRDLEVMRRKMETRTLEVDCNNQELARRCQDLLEQNRQSEDTVKQLLKSTTEHSAQLVRATDDLKEANGKCLGLREELNGLEQRLELEASKCSELNKDNNQLRRDNEQLREQVESLGEQVESLNGQLGELCQQLDVQTNALHKDREALADRLSQNEIDSAQMRHDLATARQDLRSSKLQTQEVVSERDRIKSDLEMREKYIRSRNDIIDTLRSELEDCKKSLGEYKQKIERLREETQQEVEGFGKELKCQLGSLRNELKTRTEECATLRRQCEQLQRSLDETRDHNEEEELKRFDEMRLRHSSELDELKLKLASLEEQLEEAKAATLRRGAKSAGALARSESQRTLLSEPIEAEGTKEAAGKPPAPDAADAKASAAKQKRDEYETQIEFLNSVVVDMQRKCDDYRSKLAQVETMNIMNEFDNLILSNQPLSRSATLRRHETRAAKSSAGAGLAQRPLETATLNGSSKTPTRISGRPYCDICNVYDLHHTIYCPKVSEKLASRRAQAETLDIIVADNNSSSGNNNNNNNNNFVNVDELFREYEQSLGGASESVRGYSSLRRPQTLERQPRPYCDHCDLFGHTIKSCNSLRV